MKYIISILLITISCFGLKPQSDYVAMPNNYALMYKEYDAKTIDNMNIKIWFYPAQELLSKDSISYYFYNKNKQRKYATDGKKKPTIIICNGDAGNMSYLISYAYRFCTNGFNVITFDWRGYGKSSDYPIDTNYVIIDEFYNDYDAVIDFSGTLNEVDKDRIGVFGFSTGAFFSYAMAFKHPEVKALLTRGLFCDYESTVKRLKENEPNDTYLYPKEVDRYSPKNTYAIFNKPILLVVGENDNVTPVEESLKILNNVQSRVRELWIVNNAGHGGGEAPEYIASEKFFSKAVRFFKENL